MLRKRSQELGEAPWKDLDCSHHWGGPEVRVQKRFLETIHIGREKVFLLEGFYVGEVYEVSAIGWRDTFACKEITETHAVLEWISNEEVLERCGHQKDVAVNLVQQLLKVTTKERAIMLIHNH